MASGDSMTQLRQSLDDLSTSGLGYPAPDVDYYQSVLRRLDFNFSQRSISGTDEAVRVISPEEWSLANQARAAADERQRELDSMQDHLRRVDAREGELNALIDDLQRQLEAARSRRDELVTLELVGVRPVGGVLEERREAPPVEGLVEFEEEEPEWQPTPVAHGWQVPREKGALAWEETGRGPVPGGEPDIPETWEAAPEGERPSWEEAPPEDWEEPPEIEAEPAPEEDAWQVAEPEAPAPEAELEPEPEPEPEPETAWEAPPPRVAAPAPDASAVEVEDEIRRIEDEIRKIEEELALIAAQERELESRGARPPVETVESPQEAGTGGPFTREGYTLFMKSVESPAGGPRPFYFFSKETQREDAEPSELPSGYEVAVNPRTGMPYLKRASDEE